MMLFIVITAIILVSLIGNFLWQIRLAKVQSGRIFKDIYENIVIGLKDLKSISPKKKNFFNIARKSFSSITAILFLIMATTGFSSSLLGFQLEGVLLFVHVLGAPLITISITISIALYAHNLQFMNISQVK